MTGLATNSALTAVENKKPDVSSLVKKIDYNAKISNIEKKIIDHNHDKYITNPEFNTGVWNGVKNCIKKTNNIELEKYDKDYMKIKFNSEDDILLNKVLNFPTITIIIRNIFEKDGKYYPQSFLDECLYEV